MDGKYYRLTCGGCGSSWDSEVNPTDHHRTVGELVLNFVKHVRGHERREDAILEILDRCPITVVFTGNVGAKQCELIETHAGPHRVTH